MTLAYSDTFWPSLHCHCKRGGLYNKCLKTINLKNRQGCQSPRGGGGTVEAPLSRARHESDNYARLRVSGAGARLYRGVQLKLTPEIEVLYMLFERSLPIFLSNSIWNTSISGVKSSWTTLYSSQVSSEPGAVPLARVAAAAGEAVAARRHGRRRILRPGESI